MKAFEEEIQCYLSVFPEERSALQRLLEDVEGGLDLSDRRNWRGHITASAFVVDPGSLSVLLIHHRALERWLQPGGHLESNEIPKDGAAREVQEELGVAGSSLHPWHLDRACPLDIEIQKIPANLKKGEPEHFHYDFRYLFVLNQEDKDGITIDSLEVVDAKWFDLREFVSDFDNYDAAIKVKQIIEGVSIPDQI